MTNLLSYCDGSLSLLEVAEKINVPMWQLFDVIDILLKNKLLKVVNKQS
jgi:aminopeptidase-like protein